MRFWLALTILVLVAMVIGGVYATSSVFSSDGKSSAVAVEAVLDDFHDAASKADGRRYFAHFTEDAVFLGTDASERWTYQEFRLYAEKQFSMGKGWTYMPQTRNVAVSPHGDIAWFDEILENAKYGVCRGTGVLHRVGGVWKVVQYNLTVPIPNNLLGKVVEMIQVASHR